MPASPLRYVRSFAFNSFFWLWTALLCVAALPFLAFLSPGGVRAVARAWQRGIQLGLRLLVGLDYEVRGREHLPATPVLIACKHQSAWETVAFNLLVPNLAIGLKEELTRIPLFGWYLRRARNIQIDRGATARAIRSLVDGARRAVDAGDAILIFPEGTRRGPDDPPDYKPGVAALYNALKLPVVPVALNSGLFWPRRSFLKRPGRITVEFLDPIPPGLDRKAFMAELERRIETASTRLVADARARLA